MYDYDDTNWYEIIFIRDSITYKCATEANSQEEAKEYFFASYGQAVVKKISLIHNFNYWLEERE